MDTPVSLRKTLILITGFARSGKTTLADGIVAGAKSEVSHFNFADALKQSCDYWMSLLDIGEADSENSFYNEDFKLRNRGFLVTAGEFARSLDADVFARSVIRHCDQRASYCADENMECVVVCSDWRYPNEFFAPFLELSLDGWQIVTIHIECVGVLPANEVEALSIAKIIREIPISFSFVFSPDSAKVIRDEGKHIARQLNI
jgi:hypothetical protein